MNNGNHCAILFHYHLWRTFTATEAERVKESHQHTVQHHKLRFILWWSAWFYAVCKDKHICIHCEGLLMWASMRKPIFASFWLENILRNIKQHEITSSNRYDIVVIPRRQVAYLALKCHRQRGLLHLLQSRYWCGQLEHRLPIMRMLLCNPFRQLIHIRE